MERYLDISKLLNKSSFFLFGPRGTGKSYLIRHTLLRRSNTIDYIEEEGRGGTWRHERISDEAPRPIKRPPFLEPVSPRTPHKVVDADDDEWEAVRSNAPDAPRNADAQRNAHLKAAIEGLTKALEALKMM